MRREPTTGIGTSQTTTSMIAPSSSFSRYLESGDRGMMTNMPTDPIAVKYDNARPARHRGAKNEIRTR